MSAETPIPAAGAPLAAKPPTAFSQAADKLKTWMPAEQERESILKIVQRSLDTTTKPLNP